MSSGRTRSSVEEGVVGKTVQQGRFLQDLEDGVLDWGSIGIRQRVEVDGDNGNSVRELLYTRSLVRTSFRICVMVRYSPTYFLAE